MSPNKAVTLAQAHLKDACGRLLLPAHRGQDQGIQEGQVLFIAHKPLSYLSFSLLRYLSVAVFFFLDIMHNMILFTGYTDIIMNHVVKQSTVELYVLFICSSIF